MYNKVIHVSISLLILCICIAVLSVFVYPTGISNGKSANACIDIYVNWVMDNSTSISRKRAEGICNACLEARTGLLMLAIAKRESSFDAGAKSTAGAIGLNQIMPKIWTKTLIREGIIKEKRDLFDYDKNIQASDYIITKYYNQTKSWKKALTKYVGGKHTTYVRDVLAIYGELMLLSNTNL